MVAGSAELSVRNWYRNLWREPGSQKGFAREIAACVYGAVTGRRADHLAHKRELHQRRNQAIVNFLARNSARSGVLLPNACPSCGSNREQHSFKNPVGLSFSVCSEDRTVYMNPVLSDEALGELYNDPAYTYNFLRDQPVKQRVAPSNEHDYVALLRMAPPQVVGGKLLDVGCSKGGFLLTARRGFSVVGVELSEATSATARSLGLDVTTGRIDDMLVDSSREPFDVITMLQFIEHVVNPAETLRVARKLMRPGGIVYLNTPNVDSASFRYLGRLHNHVAGFGHVSLLTKQALVNLARATGFEVMAHEFCGGTDLALHDALTLALSKKRFRHRMAFYNPRLHHTSRLLERMTGYRLNRILFPEGEESYQRAVLRRVDS